MPLVTTLGAASARGFGLFSSSILLDPYFNYNTLLLPGNGTNGAQNNTFLDSSTNNFTITRNGNTTQGTFTPYGDNWSNYFSSSQLSVANSTNLDLGSGNWTIEAWLYPTSFAAYARFFSKQASSGLGFIARLQITTGYVFLEIDQTGIVTSSTAPALNTWSHVAIVRNSNTVTIYINGTSAGSASYSGTPSSQTAKTTISGFDSGPSQGEYFPGYISNLRYVKGSAVYTSNFTPSTAPLTAITNTQLLTCQNNRFIDNSSNAFTVTVNVGSPSVQRFSPFSPSAAYAAGTIGGSGYFDGSGDWLNLNNSGCYPSGTQDTTVELWWYPTSVPSVPIFLNDETTSSFGLYYESGSLKVDSRNSSTILSASYTFTAGQWYHIAYSRSGNTHNLYVNGTRIGTGSNSVSFATAGNPQNIMAQPTSSRYTPGYATDVRVVLGTALYTGSTLTVPTAPLTAVSNTALLMSMTNGGIIDNTMMSDLETVGNAQISTTQSKFGGASMSFPGSSYLRSPSSVVNAYGTGNLTIEGWFYTTDGASTMIMVDQRTSGTTEVVPTVYLSGGTINVYVNGANLISGGSYTTSQWNHFAFCRSGTSSKLFLNGTQTGSTASDSNSYATSAISIGAYTPSPQQYFNGYIDDLRITKGIARYTANFTPPTAAFPLS